MFIREVLLYYHTHLYCKISKKAFRVFVSLSYFDMLYVQYFFIIMFQTIYLRYVKYKNNFITSSVSSTNGSFTSGFEDPVVFLYACFGFLYGPVSTWNKDRSF